MDQEFSEYSEPMTSHAPPSASSRRSLLHRTPATYAAAGGRRGRHVESLSLTSTKNPTCHWMPNLLVEQSCQISSQSDLKRMSLSRGLFWGASAGCPLSRRARVSSLALCIRYSYWSVYGVVHSYLLLSFTLLGSPRHLAYCVRARCTN